MQIKHKINHSLFIFGLTILLFVAACPLASAQTSPNDIVFIRCNARFSNCQIYTMKADGFGILTDLPTPADYDGDGKADIAVFRAGTWYLLRSASGFTGVQFGAATDKPVPNAFVP